jgi:predicted Zn-dependent peptidase
MEASQLALISRLITRGSESLPDAKALNHRLDELYGAIFSTDVVKYGEQIALHVKIQFPNKRLVENEKIFIEALTLVHDALFDVRLENGIFVQDYFDQEKAKLVEEIQSRVNDKMTYAVDRCVESMCDSEAFSVYHYGSVETVEKLENANVFAYYQDVLESSPLDVLVIGDIDFDQVSEEIESVIHFHENGIVDVDYHPSCSIRDEVNYVTETMKVNQGKLTLGYRTNIDLNDPLYEASVLFASILGSGGNSMLFRNIREKESLCYYIFSKIEKFKSIMLITSGIETENYEKAHHLIIEEVEKMVAGEFTDEDMDIAKEGIASSIKSLRDYPNSFINFYYNREVSGNLYDEKQIIEDVMAVTREEIIEAGSRFTLDTVHFIKGDDQDETA